MFSALGTNRGTNCSTSDYLPADVSKKTHIVAAISLGLHLN